VQQGTSKAPPGSNLSQGARSLKGSPDPAGSNNNAGGNPAASPSNPAGSASNPAGSPSNPAGLKGKSSSPPVPAGILSLLILNDMGLIRLILI
jgi:hypothetical protein